MAAPFKPKELVKVPFNCRLPQWLVTWLREQEDSSQAVLIEDALCEKHGLEPPNVKRE